VAAAGPAVEVDGLVISYGDTVAVDGVSFAAHHGEVTALLGPNGAGKTSTVEHLEGYRPARSGRTSVLGMDPRRDRRRLAGRVGLMLQEGGIPPAIRPHEVLEQYAGFFVDPIPPTELLERIGLLDRARTPVRRLSGGEQQRLSLALAVIGRPEVVLLDEPTAGIDLTGRDLVRRLVRELRDDGVAVLLTTHDLDEAERTADRVVIIDRGRVVADGSPAELMRAGEGDDLRFGAPAGVDVASLAEHVGGPVDEVSPGEYRVGIPATPANVAAVTAWLAERDLPLSDLRAGRQRLDDVFRRLTNESPAPRESTPGAGRQRRRRPGRNRER
jgi:ABC-2 type transport system ATP-binding protein